MTLGEKIKDRREWLGIPRRVLAERMGVNQSTLTSWEVGRYGMARKYREPLCKALNVPADYFDDVLPPVTYRDIAADCLLYDAAEETRQLARCRQSSCKTCGWYGPEMERRNERIRRHGLDRLGNGLLGLKVGGAKW